jgi:glutathione S-transferase
MWFGGAMKIYYAPNTRAVRIVWLFEELGLPYELERFKLGDAAMRAPAYLKLHPMGRVPTLQDGDVTIFESGAIVQYVLAKYGNGRLVPDVSSPDFPTYLQWLHYAEGMIMPPVNTIVVETILLKPERRNQANVDRAVKLLSQMLSAVDRGLAGRDFLAGPFSGADIMTGHACIVAARLGADVSDKSNVAAYIERLQARPALQRAWDA